MRRASARRTAWDLTALPLEFARPCEDKSSISDRPCCGLPYITLSLDYLRRSCASAELTVGDGEQRMQRTTVKIVYRLLLTVSLLSVFVTTLSGIVLQLAPAGLLLVHLVSSLVGSLTLFVFLARHLWKRHQTIGAHPNAWLGYSTLISLCLLGATGSALFIWTNYPPLRAAHYGSMLVLFTNLVVHTSWRIRRRWLRTPTANRSALARLRAHSFLPIQRPSRRGILVGLGAASLLALVTIPGRSIRFQAA